MDRLLSCLEENPHELTLARSSSVPSSLLLLLASPEFTSKCYLHRKVCLCLYGRQPHTFLLLADGRRIVLFQGEKSRKRRMALCTFVKTLVLRNPRVVIVQRQNRGSQGGHSLTLYAMTV